uniref:Uncharacterized protein n=1 Tax=Caenorhabditis japonica TaxID=281687 RepID=A0A8R1IDD0_CAEJA
MDPIRIHVHTDRMQTLERGLKTDETPEDDDLVVLMRDSFNFFKSKDTSLWENGANTHLLPDHLLLFSFTTEYHLLPCLIYYIF